MAFDLYAEITDRIIHELESGVIPWRQPWSSCADFALSHATGRPYSLLNQLLLGRRTGEYLTFKQCTEEGGRVRKGEKAHLVVFWKWLEQKDEDTGEVKQIPYLRYYNVFHIDQCDGIKPRYDKGTTSSLAHDEAADAIIDGYVQRSGVVLRISRTSQAFYRPSEDLVCVPEISQYTEQSEYYSTLFHELTHSTGHPSRLNRLAGEAVFGSEDYSKEELIAELGSAFLLHIVGMEAKSTMRNQAAYIQGWLRSLKDDKRLIVSAAGKAEKAMEMITGAEP